MGSHTIPKAARKLRLPEGQFRRAVALGQVKTIDFAGLRRISDAEIERIAELLELPISETAVECVKPDVASDEANAPTATEQILPALERSKAKPPKKSGRPA
jgi:hypothetical protein